MSGGYDAPTTLPVPMHLEEGDPAPDEDPSLPPDPMLDSADDVGTGIRTVRPLTRPREVWRRASTPSSSMPRLLPADNSARNVSRISYEELVESEAPRKAGMSISTRRLDVFQAASNLDAGSPSTTESQPEDEDSTNPLRK